MSAQSSRMYPSTHAAPRLHSDWIPSNFRCNPCSPRQVSRCTQAKGRRTGWDCIPISAPVVQDLPGGAGAIALVLAVLVLDEGVAAIVDAVVLLALPFPARNRAHNLPVAVQSPPTTIRRAMRQPVFFSCLSSPWLRNDGQSGQMGQWAGRQ